MTDIDKLDGRELDAALGEAIGATFRYEYWAMDAKEKGIYISFEGLFTANQWLEDQKDRHGTWVANNGIHIVEAKIYPCYSTDLNACRMAEAEIERRGLHHEYMASLIEIIDPNAEAERPFIEWIWKCRTASAETLCRAMVQALREDRQ